MSEATTLDEIDYGPLAALVGTWEGNKGVDIAPEPDGIENNPYYETILYEAIGDVTNAESQVLAVLRYHQVVKRISNDKVFHNETGYWSWDSNTGVITHSLTIPRGVCLLAGGKAIVNDDGSIEFNVEAAIDSDEWGIIQAPFMQENAKTTGFTQKIIVNGNQLQYSESTMLDIYGRQFEHTDNNILTRI